MASRIPNHIKRLKKNACERCGSDQNLLQHHVDFDHENDDPDNVQTLCRDCHYLIHKKPVDLEDRRQRKLERNRLRRKNERLAVQ